MKTTRLILMFVIICNIVFAQNGISTNSESTIGENYNSRYAYTVFEENFNESQLNKSIWGVTRNYKRGVGMLIDSSLTVNVSNDNLNLSMYYIPNYIDSIWDQGWYDVYSDYVGGEIRSKVKFLYGEFACRAKLAKLPGAWPAFWIIGNQGGECPTYRHGSEIDIAEYFCKGNLNSSGIITRKNSMEHNIHRYYPNNDCTNSDHKKVDNKKYKFLSNGYHIYKCCWTPYKIEYYIDDELKYSIFNNNYEWWPKHALDIILSQQVLETKFYCAPQTSYFDWVKVKQYFPSPSISCPSEIHTEGDAVLNVNELATNIKWELSPASIFTGVTSGTGINAHMSVSSSVPNRAAITYTFEMPSGESFGVEKTFWTKKPVP